MKNRQGEKVMAKELKEITDEYYKGFVKDNSQYKDGYLAGDMFKNEVLSIKDGDKVYSFEKPDFECEFWKITKEKPNGRKWVMGYYINSCIQKPAMWLLKDGMCYEDSDYNLTPIKLKWYEDDRNENIKAIIRRCVNRAEEDDSLGYEDFFKMITNEEIDQLKVKAN